jgi:hypothetical protein
MKTILEKWYSSKEKLEILEKKIQKYKEAIAREMENKGINLIKEGDFTVTRRRNTRAYLTKENVPDSVWKQYSVKSHYDAFFLKKK